MRNESKSSGLPPDSDGTNLKRLRLDEGQARLEALGSKQGRLAHFKTKAERDKYLKKEIQSIEAYQATQQAGLEEAEAELASARNRLNEVDRKAEEVSQNLEDRRERLRQVGEQQTALKDEQSTLSEQRK